MKLNDKELKEFVTNIPDYDSIIEMSECTGSWNGYITPDYSDDVFCKYAFKQGYMTETGKGGFYVNHKFRNFVNPNSEYDDVDTLISNISGFNIDKIKEIQKDEFEKQEINKLKELAKKYNYDLIKK